MLGPQQSKLVAQPIQSKTHIPAFFAEPQQQLLGTVDFTLNLRDVGAVPIGVFQPAIQLLGIGDDVSDGVPAVVVRQAVPLPSPTSEPCGFRP